LWCFFYIFKIDDVSSYFRVFKSGCDGSYDKVGAYCSNEINILNASSIHIKTSSQCNANDLHIQQDAVTFQKNYCTKSMCEFSSNTNLFSTYLATSLDSSFDKTPASFEFFYKCNGNNPLNHHLYLLICFAYFLMFIVW
jgi:hypothetical protein